MTITERIMAEHSGKGHVKPGDFILCRVDLALANDITAPLAIEAFRSAGSSEVFDREKIALIPDHFTPNRDIKSAEQAKILRQFAAEQGINHYYEVGRMGIEHALLPELGLIKPGSLVVGADSHTCTHGALGAFATGVGSTDFTAAMITGEVWIRVPETIKVMFMGKLPPWVGGKDLILYLIGSLGVSGALYQSLEFGGDGVAMLPIDDRFTLCNMVVEAGAKNGIIPVDEETERYLQSVGIDNWENTYSDEDASYHSIMEIDISELEPLVAFPPLPSNIRPISRVGEVSIDQVFIGSCTNGRLSDLRIAAGILKGRSVHPKVRLIVIPATQKIYREAMAEGLLEIFLEAGAAVSTPTCGPCLGGHMGILAAGERAVATSNRNFIGRMGHQESEVYLANPAVAAASAIAGKIASPE